MSEIDKKIKLESLITEREGMLIDNHIRERQGYAPAWDGPCFNELADEMRKLIEPDRER